MRRSPTPTPILLIALIVGEGIGVAGIIEAGSAGKVALWVVWGFVFALIIGLNLRSRR